MNERQLAAGIAKLIKHVSSDVGISYAARQERSDGPDLLVDLDAGGKKPARFVVELCADPRLARVLQAAEQALRYADHYRGSAVVGVPRLGPKLKQALKERGVGYLCLDGHVYLRGDGVLIDRRSDQPALQPLAQQGANPFADKSSLLLRYLLSQPAVSFGIRDVAARVGISPGLASRVVSRLKSDGYLVTDNGLGRLVGRDALLAEWLEFYRRRAKRQREDRFYLHARDAGSVLRRFASVRRNQDSPSWGLSFHAGASLVAPFAFFSEVHVLMGEASEEDLASFSQDLNLGPAGGEANVILVHPYYQESWSYGLREMEGLPVVSDVQLFLDLSTYPRRGAEQADRIRERILALENVEPTD